MGSQKVYRYNKIIYTDTPQAVAEAAANLAQAAEEDEDDAAEEDESEESVQYDSEEWEQWYVDHPEDRPQLPDDPSTYRGGTKISHINNTGAEGRGASIWGG